MRTKFIVAICFVLSHGVAVYGQQGLSGDSTARKAEHTYWKSFRVPLALTAGGLIAATDNEVFDKWEVRELSQKIAPGFHTHADDYLVFAPAVAVYVLDFTSVPPRSDVLNQSLILIKSEIVVAALTLSLKSLTREERPDHTTHDAFPSGHTSHVFMAATFLYKEFGKGRPWISILAYTTASGVGILRILNDRHWVSDVLVGAGIGVLSTNLVYTTHKYRWGKRPVTGQARIFPYYQQGCTGVYFAYRFASK